MMSDRDYTLIIDKSGSMSTPDQVGGRSRWKIAEESTIALARKCEEFDPDGITVYVFSGKFKRYENVTAAKVAQIFQENDPAVICPNCVTPIALNFSQSSGLE